MEGYAKKGRFFQRASSLLPDSQIWSVPLGDRGSAAEPQTQAGKAPPVGCEHSAWLHGGKPDRWSARLTTTASGSLKLKGSIWDRATWVAVRQRGKMGPETPLEHTSVSDRPSDSLSHFTSSWDLFLTLLSGSGVPPVVSLSTQGTLTCHCRFTRLPPLPWLSGSQCWLHLRVIWRAFKKPWCLGSAPVQLKQNLWVELTHQGVSAAPQGIPVFSQDLEALPYTRGSLKAGTCLWVSGIKWVSQPFRIVPGAHSALNTLVGSSRSCIDSPLASIVPDP